MTIRESDEAFLLRRHRESLAAALRTDSLSAKHAHQDFARRYADLLRNLPGACPD